MPTTVNTRGSKKRQRKEEGKGEENDEEERDQGQDWEQKIPLMFALFLHFSHLLNASAA